MIDRVDWKARLLLSVSAKNVLHTEESSCWSFLEGDSQGLWPWNFACKDSWYIICFPKYTGKKVGTETDRKMLWKYIFNLKYP